MYDNDLTTYTYAWYSHLRMIIKYRQHAVDQMLARKISGSEVELIITNYDGEPVVQSPDKKIFYKNIHSRNDNLIAAVVLTSIKQPEILEVLTVMVRFEVRK